MLAPPAARHPVCSGSSIIPSRLACCQLFSANARGTREMRAARMEHLRTLRCIALKQGIIADLISGRLPLLEATARFRQVGPARPVLARDEQAEPAAEDWCRTVIG